MTAHFEVVRTDAGFHARIVANGRIIMASEVYTRRRAALNAVAIALEAADSTQRVRRLHRETTMSGVAWDCAEGDCEHAQCHNGGESPEVEFRVCAHELDLADQAGLLDEWIPGWVMFPCQTIKALDFPPLAATEAKPGAGEGA